MAQVLVSLDAVTSDTVGEAMAFNLLHSDYLMHYIATIPSGLATLILEASWDGVNWFTVQSVALDDNAIAVISGGAPALFIRARATGLSAGRTVTAFIAVMGG